MTIHIDKDNPLSPVSGEPEPAVWALMDFYQLGRHATRSILKLFSAYTLDKEIDAFAAYERSLVESNRDDAGVREIYRRWQARGTEPPTRRRVMLYEWSRQYRWNDRIEAHVRMLTLELTQAEKEHLHAIREQSLRDGTLLRARVMARLQDDMSVAEIREIIDARIAADKLVWRGLGQPDRITGQDITSAGEEIELPQIVFVEAGSDDSE